MSGSNWGEKDASPTFIAGAFASIVLLAFVVAGSIQPQNAAPTITAKSDRFNIGHLCRAAISIVMGRPVGIIRVDSMNQSLATVSYNRPDDGTLWQQKCTIEGDHVVWAALDGRWRNNYQWEERLIFSHGNNGELLTIKQKYPDGSGSTQEFRLTDF